MSYLQLHISLVQLGLCVSFCPSPIIFRSLALIFNCFGRRRATGVFPTIAAAAAAPSPQRRQCAGCLHGIFLRFGDGSDVFLMRFDSFEVNLRMMWVNPDSETRLTFKSIRFAANDSTPKLSCRSCLYAVRPSAPGIRVSRAPALRSGSGPPSAVDVKPG